MSRRFGLLTSLVVTLGIAVSSVEAAWEDGLVVHYSFNTEEDLSGNGFDLVLAGGAFLEDGALILDGEDGTYADVATKLEFGPVNPIHFGRSDWTMLMEYATEETGGWGFTLFSVGPDSIEEATGDLSLFAGDDGFILDHWWVDAWDAEGTGFGFTSGDRNVLVITYSVESEQYTAYVVEDGEAIELASTGFNYGEAWNDDLNYGIRFGNMANETAAIAEDWGAVECEVSMFGLWERTLEPEEMVEAVANLDGPPSGKSSSPSPGNGEVAVLRSQEELSWNPGFGVTHDVYLGTDFDDVNEAGSGSAVLLSAGQSASSYSLADLLPLEWGTTYYWRIDDINDADPNSPRKGDTWSFSTEPFYFTLDPEEDHYQFADYEVEVHASSVDDPEARWPNATVWDGLEGDEYVTTDPETMWLSDVEPDGTAWILYPFDRAYKLNQIEIWNYNEDIELDLGFGFKQTVIEITTDDLTSEEVTWTEIMTVELNQAPGEEGIGATDTLALNDVVATGIRLTARSNHSGFNDQFGLSHIRLSYVPIRAYDPSPEPEEAVSVEGLELSFRAGREATEHQIHLGTDEEDLPLVTTTTETRYEPQGLPLGAEIFWQVNETEDPLLAGVVWSFSTHAFLTVDDMEDYEDSADDAEVAIWGTWVDGTDDPANGSFVGDEFGATEKDITHDDSDQSMPLEYRNTGAVATSEATRTFEQAQDFTRSEAKALTFYVHGDGDNGDGQMYVEVNGTRANVDVDLTGGFWQEVNIDLADLAGANLPAVNSLTFGIEGADSAGLVFIDNVRLYPSRCIPALAPEGDLNGDCVVDEEDLAIIANDFLAMGAPLVEYTFDTDLSDTSGNGLDGIDVDGVVVADGVLTLDGTNHVRIPFDVSPFDGTQAYSIAMDFQTEDPYVLFSSSHSTEGDDQPLAIFIANGNNAEDGAIVVDHFFVNLAEAGEGAYDGEWHTAVITFTPEEQIFTVYLDGTPGEPISFGEGEEPLIPDPELDEVRIGSTLNFEYPLGEDASGGNFVGSIDNVRVFPFAIGADDIAGLPNTVPNHPSDLNGDGVVDEADQAIVEANLGTERLFP